MKNEKQPNKWMVLIVVSIGIFMSTLDGSIVNIANPTIAAELGVDLTQIQWIVTAYMLSVTSTMLFFGKLGDKIGGNHIYGIGFLIFSLGSFFCSQASSFLLLLLSRIFQAIGGSMLVATGTGLVSNAFPAEEKGRALGMTGSIVGIGNVSGPAIGGLIISHFDWKMIFLINIPIGIIAFLLGLKFLPPQPLNKEIRSFDFPGILLFAASAILLLLNINQLDHLQLLPLLALVIAFLLFCWRETHFSQSFLDLKLFKNFDFTFGNVVGVFSYMPNMSVMFLLPFYLQDLRHFSTSVSGLIMCASPLCMALIAPIAGWLSDKFGARRLLLASFTASAVSFFLLSFLTADSSLPCIIGFLLLSGVGVGSFGSPNNSRILADVPPQKQGYGGSFLSTARTLSFAAGTAFFSWFFTWQQNLHALQLGEVEAYIAASNMTYRIALVFALIGFALIFFFFDRKPAEKTENQPEPQKQPQK